MCLNRPHTHHNTLAGHTRVQPVFYTKMDHRWEWTRGWLGKERLCIPHRVRSLSQNPGKARKMAFSVILFLTLRSGIRWCFFSHFLKDFVAQSITLHACASFLVFLPFCFWHIFTSGLKYCELFILEYHCWSSIQVKLCTVIISANKKRNGSGSATGMKVIWYLHENILDSNCLAVLCHPQHPARYCTEAKHHPDGFIEFLGAVYDLHQHMLMVGADDSFDQEQKVLDKLNVTLRCECKNMLRRVSIKRSAPSIACSPGVCW